MIFAGNRFSRKKKEREKAHEDMAWQIAQMIINDIKQEVSQDRTIPNLQEQDDKGAARHVQNNNQDAQVESTKL